MKSWTNIGIFAFSALSLGIVACSGSDGAAGPAGAKGDTGEAGAPGEGVKASAGVVVPNVGLLDRELDVTVTGDAIDFTAAAPTLDFGTGVKVSNIQVLSGTTLVAHLAIDVAATTGAHDVKITEGATSVTAKGGFKVAAPINVTATPTPLVQGGLAIVSLDNLDTLHAFDTAGNFDGIFSDGAALAAFSSVTATQAVGGLYLIDPSAATNAEFDALNVDANGNPTTTYAGGGLAITARAPTAATIGTPLTAQNLATAGSTGLFKFTSTTQVILEVGVTTTGATIQPGVAVYGSGGKFADLLNATTSVVFPTTATSTPLIATVFDQTGGGGSAADFGYTFNLISHVGTVYAEPVAAHETLAHATTNATITALPLAATDNGDIITGALVAADNDWYAFSLAANDTFEVAFSPSFDGSCDITDNTGAGLNVVDFLGDTAPLSASAGSHAPSATITTDPAGNPLAAAKYYVHVTGATATTTGNYSISVRRRPAAP
jgi:hypothetical protein